MKQLSILFLTLIITSCNSTNKATNSVDNTDIQMKAKKMIEDGYVAGQISISTKEDDCPITIKIEGKDGAYYLDPINLKEEFHVDGEKVWFKYGGLMRMNRCIKANPISIIEIIKNN